MQYLYLESKTHGQKVVTFDDGDIEIVNKHKWYLTGRGKYKHTFYACTHVRINGERTVKSMHRILLGEHGKVIDHIDRNGLNNCRSNLRFASHRLNRTNSKLNSNNTSGEKNIQHIPATGIYTVMINYHLNGKKKVKKLTTYSMYEAIKVRDYYTRMLLDEDVKKMCHPCYSMNLGFNRIGI